MDSICMLNDTARITYEWNGCRLASQKHCAWYKLSCYLEYYVTQMEKYHLISSCAIRC